MYNLKIKKLTAKCKTCNKIVKTGGGGTSNIKNHLKTNHFTLYYEKENATSAPKSSEQNIDSVSLDEDSDSQHSLASPARPSPSPTLLIVININDWMLGPLRNGKLTLKRS